MEIPRLAGELLCNHWAELLFWFFAQRATYFLCLKLSVVLAERSALLGYVGISMLVVVQLATTAMLFIAVKPSLPAVSQLASSSWLPPLRPWGPSLSAALLPFFAFYVTWGLLENVKRDFGAAFYATDLAAGINRALQAAASGQESTPVPHWRNVMALERVWVALAIAAVVRYLARYRARLTGKLGWTLLATLCEAYWIFIGVTALGSVMGQIKSLWQDTVVWQAVSQWWANPVVLEVSLDAVKAGVVPLWEVIRVVAAAALVPLVWLAITAIIYGLDLRRRQRLDGADERLAAVAGSYQRSHFLLRKMLGKLSAGWVNKGVPVVNSIRLVLRAGVPALLVLCVCWELLAFLDAWGWRLVVNLIGAMDGDTWRNVATPVGMLIGDPTTLLPSLFLTMLRTVLLAAAFDRAIAQLRPITPESIEAADPVS